VIFAHLICDGCGATLGEPVSGQARVDLATLRARAALAGWVRCRPRVTAARHDFCPRCRPRRVPSVLAAARETDA
jgi:hypothetical protein